MKAMEEMIMKSGKVLPGNILKVGNFLNQQLDVAFLAEVGRGLQSPFLPRSLSAFLPLLSKNILLPTSRKMSTRQKSILSRTATPILPPLRKNIFRARIRF